jgi:NAD(P)H-flavin reductase
MIKPVRGSCFLARPISIFEFVPMQNIVKFLITKRGKGTEEMSQMKIDDKAELTGPIGNCWESFLPENGKVALVGGGAGVAPLAALAAEKPDYFFHFYAGFRTGFQNKDEENAMLGAGANAKKVIVAAEDGRNALGGRIVDYIFEPNNYDAIFTCGPAPMLKAVIEKCKAKGVSCYVSMERRMACGIGACLGCTIRTVKGNRRCCVDGPIFPAEEIVGDE